MRVDARRLGLHRPDAALHLDHLPDVPVRDLRLGAGSFHDPRVEPGRRFFQRAQRGRDPARFVERGLFPRALGATREVRLDLRGAQRIQLAEGEIEEQVLGLGMRHARPILTPGSGSSSPVSASTPAASSALRSPSSA